jgi:hypothetical protein
MAKKNSNSSSSREFMIKAKKNRPDIHAKSNTSKQKKSKNYKKRYVGQGR